jgi:hypothetical protein
MEHDVVEVRAGSWDRDRDKEERERERMAECMYM